MIQISKKLKNKRSFTVFKKGDDPFLFASCYNHLLQMDKEKDNQTSENKERKGFLNFNLLNMKRDDKISNPLEKK